MENHIHGKLPSDYKAVGFNREGRNSIMFNISIMLSTLTVSLRRKDIHDISDKCNTTPSRTLGF